MFTGIVREVGQLKGVKRRGSSMRIEIRCVESAADAALGDSIAVNGVCLTAVAVQPGSVVMDVGEETYQRTNLSRLATGGAVNLEPSLKLGDKLGGHIVTGHVDAVGKIVAIRKETTQVVFSIQFPDTLRTFLAEKGSVALNGVSLTVGRMTGDIFETYLIPHTVASTTFRDASAGDTVNIEADILARYVQAAIGRGADGGERLGNLLKQFEYM